VSFDDEYAFSVIIIQHQGRLLLFFGRSFSRHELDEFWSFHLVKQQVRFLDYA
jgi:hypothetical protein